MKTTLKEPPLRAYKLGLLFVVGVTLGATQDVLFDEVTVWSRETQLLSTLRVKTAPPEPMATPTSTPHPNSYKIDRFLAAKNSPMIGTGQVYTEAAGRSGVDPFLMVAISGKESSFGKHACGYNVWGIGNCRWGFRSYQHGIEYLSRLLAKPLYSGKSLRKIAYTYCPPSSGCNTEKWIADVTFFMRQLQGQDIAMQATPQ